jgi:hypothetical protein
MINMLFKSIDLMPSDIGLNYRGKTKYKSLTGGMMSILIIIFTIIGLIYFGRELYEKRYPIMISSTSFNPMPSNSSLNSENFPFFLAVEDYSNNLEYFIDNTIYEMTARIYKRIVYKDQQGNFKVNITKTYIKLEQCNINKHFSNVEDIYGNYLLEKAWCIRPEDNHFIKGDYSVNEFYELQFYVTPCWNRTENNNKCQSQVEIAKRLDGAYVVYDYGYYFLSPKNYTHPLNRRNKELFTRVTTYTYKKVFSYMKKLNFTTDSGLVFEDFSTESYIQADSVYEVLEPSIPKKGEAIWSLDLRMSFNEDLYTRNYLKFQSLLAIMGGLYNGLIQISIIFNFILFKHFFWIDLMNDNFKINLNTDELCLSQNKIVSFQAASIISKVELIKTPNKKIIYKSDNYPLSQNKNSPNSHKNISDIIEKLKVKKPLTFNPSQYIYQFFCSCFSKENNIIMKNIFINSRKILQEMLDINTIIQKQIEFNRLKYLKLTEKELVLFHALPHPIINFLSHNEIKDPYFDLVVNNKVDTETVANYFSQRSEEGLESQKIFKLFGNDIISTYEYINKQLKILK